MPDISITVQGYTGNPVPAGQFSLLCVTVRDNDPEPRGFDAVLNHADNATQKLAAIQARAVGVWQELGVTVGTNDKKTVFGAPAN